VAIADVRQARAHRANQVHESDAGAIGNGGGARMHVGRQRKLSFSEASRLR
jgi:hypothetical protein